MPGGNSNRLRSCNTQVKALCHKAMARGHSKCNQQKKAKNVIGSKINLFLQSLGVADSRDGISLQATGVEYNTEYRVYSTLKIRIDTAVTKSSSTECEVCSDRIKWTNKEHKTFVRGILLYGIDYQKITALIPSRSEISVRLHGRRHSSNVKKLLEEKISFY